MKKLILGLAVGALTLSAFLFSQEIVRVTTAWAQNAACNIDNCREQGGSRWSIGGSLDVISTGELDIETGGTLLIAGSDVTPELLVLDGYTGTAANLNVAADPSAGAEIVTATNVITAAESGKTFFLDTTAEFVSTLPVVAVGLNYKFIVTQAPVGVAYTIVSEGGDDTINVLFTAGGINDASDQAVAQDLITFAASASLIGDWVECTCDGVDWYCQGSAAVAAGITTGQS